MIPSKQMFAYDSNAASKQLKGNDNRYVVVSGRNVNYSITIFDDDINYKTTTTTHRTDSYKIDLLPLKDGSINIGWTDGQVDKRGGIVYIAKYTLNSDDTFTEQKIASWGTDNYYISCIEMNNNDLVCQYISYKCKEEYKVFDSDYTFKNGNGIWDSKDCGFDKVIKLDGEYLAFSFLMGSTFKVRVYEHFSDGTIAPKFNELVDIMSDCEVNTIKTDISHFSGNKFIGTCIKNYTTDIPSAQVAIAEYFPGENVIRSYTIQSSGTYANYPFATKFGDDFISIFYNIKNVGNVFEILEMPNCQGFSIEMFAGQTSSSFSMEKDKYVIKGSGDSNDTLNVIYLELPSEGVVYFQDNNTAIESNKVYAIQNLYYVAPSVAGTYTLKFAGVNHDNKLGKWCSVTITVKACYPGCKSCNEYGNENDNKCINGCLTDQGYYPILGISESKCAKDLQNYYVNQVEGGWKRCHDNCATCSKDFTATEENCDTCKSDKYKIDGDTTGKCTNTITDGYYLDTTGSVSIIKKCYKTCGKCSNGGTDGDNKCTECLSNTFTFEDIEGKCDSTDTSPNKNYYLDTTVTPNKWMKCHSTCATCSTGGSGSAHNCLTCISGYKKKEGTTDCINTLPPYYYDAGTEYKKCDPACATCHGAPFTSPSTNTNCITCRTDLDYYPYDTTDTVKNCVSTVPSGYYKDTTTTPPSYKKCNDACLECNGAATDTTTNCVEGKCADTYYGVDGLLTNCLKNPPLYYFKDTSVTPNIYKQCHSECLTCSGVGDSTDFKCIACKVNGQNGYTGNTGHKIENTNNCYYSTPDYYFLDSDNVYKKCYDSCLSCKGAGNANEHRCDSCKDSTYKKIHDTNNCVTSTPEYYYDAGDKYKPCYSTCATCNGDGTEDDNNCLSCRGENKFKYPTKNCISSQPDHYYLEGDSYKKCDDSCDTCSGGTENDCTKCFYDNGYYPISVSGTPPTTFRCYNTKPDNTYYLDTVNKVYSKCYSTCASCSLGGDDTDNHCDSCDNTTYFPLFEKQSNCASNPPHYYKDGNYYKKCFTNCDTCSIGGDETNNNCLTCLSGTQSFDKGDGTFNCKTECLYNQKYYEGTCQYCPNETAVEGNFCINCKSESKYKLEDSIECTSTSCIENPCDVSVPDGYYKVDDNFNYYKKCDPNCKTCSGSSTTCTSCDTSTSILYNSHCYSSCPDDSKQLYRLDNSCVETCPEEYIVDEANHQCLSCLPNYKKKGDNTRCYTSSELPEGYFIIDTTNNIFDMCYSTCKECSAISTDGNNQKCTSCKDTYFLELLPSTNCVPDCGSFLVADSASHKCVNCKKENPPQYKDLGDNTKCVDSQPSNSVMKNETTNTFEFCHANCATCSKVGTDNDQQCDMCKELSYKEYSTKNCIPTCTDVYYQDELNRECVNCLKDRGQFKFNDENQCTSNDSNSYSINNETGLIGRCFSSCETCNGAGTESNHNCKSCKSGFYLNGTNCTDSCPNTLVKGNDGKCVSCRVSDTEGFKYLDEEICYQSLPDGAYVIDKVNNIIAKCFDSCFECDEVGDETNHKCKKCKSEFNLQFGTENCKTGCEPNYAVEDNKCISCASKDQFHIVGEVSCIPSIEHTYPVDPTTNTFGRCHAKCDTCSTGGDDTNNNCNSCLAPYYKENKDSSQCTDICDSKLVADDGSRTCINCKTHIENKEQYLNPDTHQCVENIPDGYYVSEHNYNVLAKCHPNCATCSTGPNGYDQQNCLTCTGDRYMQSGTTNCESFCSNPYAKDDSNQNDQKCILCSSIGKVKYENQDRCIDRPDNTYFSEEKNGVIKDCDSTCSSCSSAVKCDTCRVGYIFHPKDDTRCIEKCSNLWYINDRNEYQCESGSSCDTVTDRTFLDENTKQCVKSCSSSDCIGCSNLYQYQKKCVSSCPSGFIVNMLTKKCEEEPEDGDNCKVIFSTSYKNNKSQLPSMAVQRANSYINRYSASSMNNVDIIKTAAFTFHLFKSDECEYETSNNYSLSYVNFTDCKLKIIAANSSIANENILFIKVDLNQTGDTNQVVYDAYNIITKKFIDLSICNDIVVNYPLTNKVRLGSAEKMLLQGIDVYNSSDPFFNDFCYPFYSEDGKDVLMKNRRSDYYIENSLCEDGCNYTKINFKSGMVECDCEHQSNKGLDTVNSILEKVPIDGFGDSLSTSNLFVVRCYNLVFDFKYMKKNIGCWLMLLLFFFQIPPMITFLFAGMNSLYSYLNQVSNQKQIDLMKEKEEQNEEEEEDDEEDEENDGSSMPSNPPKKKSTNNNVTDEEYGTPAKLMEKVPGKKLTMLDLNQKNNYVDKYSDSTKKIMNTDYMHVQKTSMNSNFTDTNNPNTGSENENSKPDDYEQDDYDEMVYENAIQYDKRSLCSFFIHAMSMKIVFLAPCSNISIYEPFCVKIVAFFLNIATYLVMNAILFDESYIEKRYNETGKTGFVYMIKNEIPKCIYASLASTVIGFLIMYLTNAKKRFKVAIDTQKDPTQFIARTKKIISQLKCKIIGFFITSIILMGLFWYYISAFCAVYQKTQVPWLEGCLITFVFCVILQIIYALLITMFRYMGLKCKISCCYTLSTYLL